MMKPRPTEAEFEELKRQRDAAVMEMVAGIAAEWGVDPSQIKTHVSHSHGCYCACPDGPCQHIWDGPEYTSEDEYMSSVTCSRCGVPAIYHDMRCAP